MVNNTPSALKWDLFTGGEFFMAHADRFEMIVDIVNFVVHIVSNNQQQIGREHHVLSSVLYHYICS